MRPLMIAALAALPLPALAEIDLSAEIARDGLAKTEARLAALSSPTGDETFALGGVRFLRVVEAALQKQRVEGLYDATGLAPFIGVVEPTPRAQPLRPEALSELLTEAVTGLDAARAPLSQIGEGADIGVILDLGALWFDIDANGVRAPEENAMDLLGPLLLGWQWSERDPATPSPVIRFDGPDAAWLSAYTHVLAGMSEIILAYDPTPALQRLVDSQAAFSALSPLPPEAEPGYFSTQQMATSIDSFAPIVWLLEQDPDPARMSSAHAHFLAMVADNRRFWDAVAKETDNDREWLPNDSQTAALGIDLPKGTGTRWLGFLSDFEAVLKGEKLLPFWRLGPDAGVNVAKLFTGPRPVDIGGWIQGADALPYLEQGTVVSGESWTAFEQSMSGDAMLFVLYLN